MTNADKFKNIFGLYATELWSMPEKDFLKWLNSEAMNCSEFPNNSDSISRQAAIDALADMHCKSDENGYVWIIRSDAWARIDALTSVTPTKIVAQINFDNAKLKEIVDEAVKRLEEELESKQKRGKWIYGEDEYGIDGYHCDKCGFFVPWDYTHKFINYIEDYNFCPSCGADMRGEQDGRDD